MENQSITIIVEEELTVESFQMDSKGSEALIQPDGSFVTNKPPPAGVRYRVEYRRALDNKIIHSADIERLDVGIENMGSGPDVFDIVTTYRTSDTEFGDDKGSNRMARKTPQVTDTRKSVEMHIHSMAIINALRSVIVIPAPYPILVHHEKELRDFMEKCSPAKQTKPACPREKNAYEDIGLLLEFLEETVMPEVRLELERNAKGLETFKMGWVRLKPGLTIKSIHAGETTWYGGVIHSVTGGTLGYGSSSWELLYWTLNYNGVYIGINNDDHSILTERFEGERTIEELEIISKSAFEEPLDESVKELVDQGEKTLGLLSKRCQDYNGTTFDFPHRRIEGLVMVDMKCYYSDIDSKLANPTKPSVTYLAPVKGWVTECTCLVCSERKWQASESPRELAIFGGYHGIYSEDMDDENTLSAHMCYLLPPCLWGFVFKTRTWENLNVKSFQEPKFQQNMIDKMVMNPARVKTLKALAGSYIRQNIHGETSEQRLWSADFIQGKGKGQIFLLHGSPGVGKTCTAEFTKRPLMVLTSSDIGANPDTVESILMEQFKRASSWGAVLLIDEADVFMERRSTNDLTRNCLVAGFIRALEFYDGILFLTTNRVGSFDDAFISRIHVQLYYKEFTDDERQQIWQTFIDKLKEDRGKTIRVTIDAKEFIKGNEVREVKWNAREIRNAFQTAVALAEYEAEKDEEGKIQLKDTHLSSIVAMSKDFKVYLEKVHGANEEKRAAIDRTRAMENSTYSY